MGVRRECDGRAGTANTVRKTHSLRETHTEPTRAVAALVGLYLPAVVLCHKCWIGNLREIQNRAHLLTCVSQ